MELLTIVHPQKIDYIPIIFEFTGKIRRHILLYDEARTEKEYAFELKKSIEKLNQKYKFNPIIEMIEIDEDSKRDMENIAKSFQGDRRNLYLNGAGADTALFTVLSSIVLRNGGQVLAYDNDDNTYNLITKNGFTNEKIENSMNIEDFLTLMGEEIIEEKSKKDIFKNQEVLLKLFSDMPRVFNVRYLLKQGKTKELKARYPKILYPLKKLNIVDNDYKIKGYNAFVKFGYLFEDFVYLNLEPFEFDDIKVGVKIKFDEMQVSKRDIEVTNEFDILIINENKIGFIECKMGDSSDPLSTIYKSDSIMEYFGESASSLIVNLQRDTTPHKKNSKKNFSPSLILRAKSKKVNIFNSFELGKHKFRDKIIETFGVKLKPEYINEYKKHHKKKLSQLQGKWN